MSYRRSSKNVNDSRDWQAFVARNQSLITSASLPIAVTQSGDHWDDFLMHGYLDHHYDPSGFSVSQLDEKQYASLVQLVEAYFDSGHEYFTVMALSSQDQQSMRAKFEKN